MIGDDVNIQFDANEYARPNQKWRCGRADEGLPCPSGPHSDGSCGAICTPHKKEDRYYCENASMLGGSCDFGPQQDGSCCFSPAQCVPVRKGGALACGRGVCPDGPTPDGACCQQFTPCRPVRTVMARRRLFSLCAFAAALAAACLMLGGTRSERNRMLSPGQLAANHMAVADDCNQCHASGEGDVGVLLDMALAGESALAQNKLCMNCHHGLGTAANLPHSCQRSTLDAITQRIEPSGGGPALLGLSRAMFGTPHRLACAACHHEHHGADHDLQRMTDSQCQSCHASRFESFENGHPEFSAYPYQRRTRIYFDHESHYGVHFRDAARLPARGDLVEAFLLEDGPTQQSCQACHTPDLAGEKMLVRPFAQSCAACHEHQIKDDMLPGLAVFALPALDPDVFKVTKSKRQPQTFEAAGSLPPIMRFLLSADTDFAALDAAAAELDLSDVRAGSEDVAQAYIQALKSELKRIDGGGQPAIEQRLAELLGPNASADEVSHVAGLVRHDWITLARRHILSMLDHQESAAAAAGGDVVPAGEDNDDLVAVATAKLSNAAGQFDRGWYIQTRDMSLRYRPTGHADPLLKAWLEMATRLGGDEAGSPAARDLYRALSHPAAAGRCMKCHTVDPRPGGGLSINWNPYRPIRGERTFTKFAHQPHLIMFSQHACTECHMLKGPAGEDGTADDSNSSHGNGTGDRLFRPEFISDDWQLRPTPTNFRANFQPVMKADCTACHQSDRVTQSCTTCHNYHVTDMRR